ncbi:hypothetical protein J2S36_000402 [Arcanobacterium hippocoleae]|uniref:Uncharacterized protein n=1 Tax=Arcanobacterium hippocoleae TaxID=149017 RepID=A0ABU1T0G1_9ACTO|nr:hypothetical protein [Arcanobacterium hippocoleae]
MLGAPDAAVMFLTLGALYRQGQQSVRKWEGWSE